MRVKKHDTARKLNKEVLITNFELPKSKCEPTNAEQLKILEGGRSYGNDAS